jgi:hypothetical protein
MESGATSHSKQNRPGARRLSAGAARLVPETLQMGRQRFTGEHVNDD